MQRFALILLLILGISGKAGAHDYYFAFAEVEFNALTNKIEATLIVTEHDFIEALSDSSHPFTDANSILQDSLGLIRVISYINEHFNFKQGEQQSTFNLEGFDSMLNGQLNIYLSSDFTVTNEPISIAFNLLMETYSGQQNKITAYYKGNTQTLTFIKGEGRKQLSFTN